MSDPAQVAAQKVWRPDWSYIDAEGKLTEAARAMAEPLRELHRPVHPIFSWSTGLQLLDPCPGCDGKAGYHPCGCWGDADVEFVCRTCRDDRGRHVDWPCANAEHLYTTEELTR